MICKFCGEPIYEEYPKQWVHLGSGINEFYGCSFHSKYYTNGQYTGNGYAKPLIDSDIVDRILTKYSNEV